MCKKILEKQKSGDFVKEKDVNRLRVLWEPKNFCFPKGENMRKEMNLCMHKKNLKLAVLAITSFLAVSFLIGGVYAYLSHSDSNINTFTIGDVHIKAWEPNFPTKDDDGNGVPDECELMIPYETIAKDPRIKNTGTNDAVVFFKVTAPVEKLNLIGDNGGRSGEKDADLFWFKQAGDDDDSHINHFDESWIELTSLDQQFVECEECNEEGKGFTYIFGYQTSISSAESTTTLFDQIQNKKYGSRTIGPNEIQQIRIEAYAIQAEDIHRAGIEVDTDGLLTEEDLTYIYEVFVNQNKAVNLKYY